MSAFLDSSNKVNAIYPAFVEKLGFVIWSINIGAQKIDSTILETYRMIIAVFSVIDQANKIMFFEETFLVVNISLHMVLGMLFLILSDGNIDFPKKKH